MRLAPLAGSALAHFPLVALVASWASRPAGMPRGIGPVDAWLLPTGLAADVRRLPDRPDRPDMSDGPDMSDTVAVELVRDPDMAEPGLADSRTPGPGLAGSRTPAPGLADSRTPGPGLAGSRTSELRTAGHGGEPSPGASGEATAGTPAGKRKPGPGSLYNRMRPPAWHLSDGDADGILDHPLEPPPQVFRSGRLDSAPGARGVVRDAVTTVVVEGDGTAHFHDAPDIDIHLELPLPGWHALQHPERAWRDFKKEIGDGLEAWYKDPGKLSRGGDASELPDHQKAEPGQCDRWGDSMCAPEPMPPPGAIAGGKADLTSYLMRKLHVGDPFASRKRALLDSTRPERAERGATFRAEQLDHSFELMRGNLERLWATTTDPVARRAALFTMWDECAEGDGTLGEAGQRARAEVIGWIRARLPRGSAGAYSDAEIEELAARRSSHQPFEPY